MTTFESAQQAIQEQIDAVRAAQASTVDHEGSRKRAAALALQKLEEAVLWLNAARAGAVYRL